jgi:hypothetical protein
MIPPIYIPLGLSSSAEDEILSWIAELPFSEGVDYSWDRTTTQLTFNSEEYAILFRLRFGL